MIGQIYWQAHARHFFPSSFPFQAKWLRTIKTCGWSVVALFPCHHRATVPIIRSRTCRDEQERERFEGIKHAICLLQSTWISEIENIYKDVSPLVTSHWWRVVRCSEFFQVRLACRFKVDHGLEVVMDEDVQERSSASNPGIDTTYWSIGPLERGRDRKKESIGENKERVHFFKDGWLPDKRNYQNKNENTLVHKKFLILTAIQKPFYIL